MRIIAYQTSTQDSKVLLQESTGEYILSNEIEGLFGFLLEPYDSAIRVCWDLDATVSAFLKLLGVSICRNIRETKRCHKKGDRSCPLHPVEVFYIPDKVFSVSRFGLRANLYGLEQYFPELNEPDVKEVQLLGMELLAELKKMGLNPTKFTSPVAIYEECVLKNLDLPLAKDMPVEACEFAWRCSGKLWIESHQIGFWG